MLRSPRAARRSILFAGTVLVLAACSGSLDDAFPPPATRETTPPSSTASEGTDPDDQASAVGVDTAPSETSAAEGPPPAARDYSIEWSEVSGGIEEGVITVPLDYDDPQGDTLDLYVARHRAPDDSRIGVLFTNPGGPGVGASTMALNASSWFEAPLIDRFDIVAWDPRGTGISEGAIDCIDDDEYDVFYASTDPSPDTDEERGAIVDLAARFGESCAARDGLVLPHIGTNNTARDMDAIRQALGEDQASYFGFSYGSELGAVWATLFPDTVRAAVFDGAADPDADGIESTKQQWVGFERALNTFLSECSADSSCAFHNGGDAEAAFDELFSALDDEALPSTDGRPPVGLEVAINGVVQSMYSDSFWPALERALDDASAGDGAGLLQLHDGYFRRNADGSYSNLLEAFQAITCADDADRLTVEEADERGEELVGVAPRLFPYTTGSYTCTFFPPADDPRIEVTGDRAGPIVVVGTTGDPSTPLESSRAMADALEDGRFVQVEANQHTAYRSGDCIDDLIHDYLIWLAEPPSDAVCP
jgi:pimeloyl-ACP methyl ester carboxylesterase